MISVGDLLELKIESITARDIEFLDASANVMFTVIVTDVMSDKIKALNHDFKLITYSSKNDKLYVYGDSDFNCIFTYRVVSKLQDSIK